MRQSVRVLLSAERAVTLDASHAAADTAATHNRFANAKITITAIGTTINTASENQRTTPRRERNPNAAATLTTAPARPTASIARLLSSAKTIRINTASAASKKLRRASQL